jgi:hypothetical protein
MGLVMFTLFAFVMPRVFSGTLLASRSSGFRATMLGVGALIIAADIALCALFVRLFRRSSLMAPGT